MKEQDFIRILLPKEVQTYFEVTQLSSDDSSTTIYLSEINSPPEEYSSHKLTSKGFMEEVCIQDFPLRGKPCYLRVKRRRWNDTTTGLTVVRDWNLVAKGTRITDEFATFLKGIN